MDSNSDIWSLYQECLTVGYTHEEIVAKFDELGLDPSIFQDDSIIIVTTEPNVSCKDLTASMTDVKAIGVKSAPTSPG